MNFGQAIEALKSGKQVARSGWNGKNMFLVFVPGSKNIILKEGTPYMNSFRGQAVGCVHTINPHIDMYTASGEFQPGWLASQTDMLAEDWVVV